MRRFLSETSSPSTLRCYLMTPRLAFLTQRFVWRISLFRFRFRFLFLNFSFSLRLALHIWIDFDFDSYFSISVSLFDLLFISGSLSISLSMFFQISTRFSRTLSPIVHHSRIYSKCLSRFAYLFLLISGKQNSTVAQLVCAWGGWEGIVGTWHAKPGDLCFFWGDG